MLAARQSVPSHSTFRRSTVLLAGLTLVAVAACADHKRTANADSDLTRDLQLAGQINAQPTFQDTALSSAAPLRASAPTKTPAPTPTRSARQERRMTPAAAPQDVRPSILTRAPMPAAASAPSREIGAGTVIVMSSGVRACPLTYDRGGDRDRDDRRWPCVSGDESPWRQDRGADRLTREGHEWRADPSRIKSRDRDCIRDAGRSGTYRLPRPRAVSERLAL